MASHKRKVIERGMIRWYFSKVHQAHTIFGHFSLGPFPPHECIENHFIHKYYIYIIFFYLLDYLHLHLIIIQQMLLSKVTYII